MGQACSSKDGDHPQDLESYAREDDAGRRRLSVITLAGTKEHEKLPPTTSKDASRIVTHPSGVKTLLDIFCVSFAGTYAPDSFKENQDDYFAFDTFGNNESSIFCVMDGHGVAGRQASSFVRTTLTNIISKDERLAEDATTVIRQAFFRAHRELQNSRVDCTCSGSTCVMCYIDYKRNTIMCANAGDSRCVLGYMGDDGKVHHKDLSNDHKPELPQEKSRIESSGGRVEPMRDARHEPIGPPRVWVAREMYPGLAMSRSIGDSIAQSVGVTCEPEIITHTLSRPADQFLVLASDGVWEFISSQEAIGLVSSAANAEEAAVVLCKEALRRWAMEEEVCDDITAVVVFLKEWNEPKQGSVEVQQQEPAAPAAAATTDVKPNGDAKQQPGQ